MKSATENTVVLCLVLFVGEAYFVQQLRKKQIKGSEPTEYPPAALWYTTYLLAPRTMNAGEQTGETVGKSRHDL